MDAEHDRTKGLALLQDQAVEAQRVGRLEQRVDPFERWQGLIKAYWECADASRGSVRSFLHRDYEREASIHLVTLLQATPSPVRVGRIIKRIHGGHSNGIPHGWSIKHRLIVFIDGTREVVAYSRMSVDLSTKT